MGADEILSAVIIYFCHLVQLKNVYLGLFLSILIYCRSK